MRAVSYHGQLGSVYALYEIDHTGRVIARDVTRHEWADAHTQGSGTDRHGALSWVCRRCGGRQYAAVVDTIPLTLATRLHLCVPTGAPARTYVPALPLAQARQ